jgi:hypothetical protein
VSAPLAAWHWLAPGFPSLDTPPPPLAAPGTAAPLSSLLRQADLELPPRAALTIVVPDELGGLDAERVRLTHPFTWRVLPGADRTVVSGAPSRANAPLLLAVRTDAQSGVELPLVRALAAAWQIEGENIQWDIATADAPLPATSAWLIWLAGPLPPGIDAWVRRGGTVLASRQTASGGGAVVLSEASGAALLRERQLGLGRVVSLAGPLRVGESATLSSAEFPHTVLALLRGPPPVPERAAAVAVTPLAAGHAPLGAAHALLPYLALIVALLFLGERLLASRARVRA